MILCLKAKYQKTINHWREFPLEPTRSLVSYLHFSLRALVLFRFLSLKLSLIFPPLFRNSQALLIVESLILHLKWQTYRIKNKLLPEVRETGGCDYKGHQEGSLCWWNCSVSWYDDEYLNLHLWWNYIEPTTFVCTHRFFKNWGNLNKISRL